jgi:FtsZ-binding cell division protein ZapB
LVDAIDNAAGVVEGGRFTAIGTSASLNTGLQGRAESGESARGVSGRAINSGTNVGVFGNTLGQGSFAAAIYGETPQNGNHFAGFFDGDVVVTQQFSASDAKLKSNVSNENDALRQISQLRPVTYLFKENSGMNLSREFQHGFIAQELAEVFPELTKDIKKPVFDEEGNVVSELEFKSVNYIGLISVLTAGIQELNEELNTLKEELAEYKSTDNVRQSLMNENNDVQGYFMEQNVPNPFDDATSIRYQLPAGVNQAYITIFDLNGRLIKDYLLTQNQGELIIQASEIGKGLFIYSMNVGGKEMLTKKMMVK